MKKMTKALAGLGVFLLVAGLVLSGAGLAMGARTNLSVDWFGIPINVGVGGIGYRRVTGGTEQIPPEDSVSVVTSERLAAFDELEVDVALGDVTVEQGEDYGVELSWNAASVELYYEVKGGTLLIWNKDQVNISLGSGMFASVRVSVPEGVTLDKVSVDTDLGDCRISDLQARELDVEAELGAVSLSNVTADEADLELSLGNLELWDVTAGELEANLSLGDLTGSGLTVSRELKAENDMGSIDLAGDLRGTAELTDNMGGVSLFIQGAEGEYGYDLKTSLGSVRVNGEDQGDKVSRPGGRDTLTVRNSMGDIDVTFEG